jgi:hypothetical protein
MFNVVNVVNVVISKNFGDTWFAFDLIKKTKNLWSMSLIGFRRKYLKKATLLAVSLKNYWQSNLFDSISVLISFNDFSLKSSIKNIQRIMKWQRVQLRLAATVISRTLMSFSFPGNKYFSTSWPTLPRTKFVFFMFDWHNHLLCEWKGFNPIASLLPMTCHSFPCHWGFLSLNFSDHSFTSSRYWL